MSCPRKSLGLWWPCWYAARHGTAAIDTYPAHHNENCKPFVWKATADAILDKVKRSANELRRHDIRDSGIPIVQQSCFRAAGGKEGLMIPDAPSVSSVTLSYQQVQ